MRSPATRSSGQTWMSPPRRDLPRSSTGTGTVPTLKSSTAMPRSALHCVTYPRHPTGSTVRGCERACSAVSSQPDCRKAPAWITAVGVRGGPWPGSYVNSSVTRPGLAAGPVTSCSASHRDHNCSSPSCRSCNDCPPRGNTRIHLYPADRRKITRDTAGISAHPTRQPDTLPCPGSEIRIPPKFTPHQWSALKNHYSRIRV